MISLERTQDRPILDCNTTGLMNAIESTRQTELGAFFEQYAKASQAQNPQALAAMYAASFIVGGPEGSMSFTNDARFIEWLKQVYDFNQKHGMRALEIVSVDPIALSPAHTLAIVRWGARFERTGDRLVEFQISYLLEHTTEKMKILSYISQADQQAEMRALGLL
jgi:hypothetical protein